MKLRLCLMLLCAAIGMSCTKPMDMNSITGITLDKTTLSLVVGTDGQLVAAIVPAEAKAVAVKWVSSDPSVATVTESGKVAAIKAGTSTITATVGSFVATCVVTVTVTPVVLVSIHAASDVVVKGAKLALTVSLNPEPADKLITWSSNNDAIATVSQTGEVTGVEAGTVIITAKLTNGSALGTLAITVLPALPTLYVAGVTGVGQDARARVWKNGAPMNLTLNGGSSSANGLLFDGSSLYVVGSQMVGAKTKAFLWENSVDSYELSADPDENTDAFSVTKAVSGLRVAGSWWFDGSKAAGKLWLGLGTDRNLDNTTGAVAVAPYQQSCIFLINAKGGTGVDRIQTLIEGSSAVDLTDGSVNALGSALQVVDATVYVAGREENRPHTQGGLFEAKVWKDGVATNYSTGGLRDVELLGLVVSNGAVYAVGSYFNTGGVEVATVWKDGNVLYRLSDGTKNARATGIVKFGEYLYVSGFEEIGTSVAQAKVWVNDKVLWTLSDPAKNSRAVAICLGQ